MKSFRYRAHPNVAQTAAMDGVLLQCAELYNAALEQRNTAWRQQRKSISLYEQQTELTTIRASDPAWEKTSVHAQRSALMQLDRAFVDFFHRVKAGVRAGLPRFKAARRFRSFKLHRGAWAPKHPILVKDRLHVPKIGHVKLNLYRAFEGEIKEVTIHRDGVGRWWVTFSCDVGEAPAKVAVRSVIGIDLGVKDLVTLSNGEAIANPRCSVKLQPKLVIQQRAVFRKQKGSENRKRARDLVSKTQAHVANQRLDYARKTAKTLFERFDLIAHEDPTVLRLKEMAGAPFFSKIMHDAAWGVLLRCLHAKAESAGKWLVPVDPKGTSQLCSGCGARVEKTLAERTHNCPKCGLTIGRDHNSAITVLARGLRALELEQSSAEGEVLARA
jgi:putative transposase